MSRPMVIFPVSPAPFSPARRASLRSPPPGRNHQSTLDLAGDARAACYAISFPLSLFVLLLLHILNLAYIVKGYPFV